MKHTGAKWPLGAPRNAGAWLGGECWILLYRPQTGASELR
jgi:hypothetical protein